MAATSFLDLSAELRNTIYELALKPRQRLQIVKNHSTNRLLVPLHPKSKLAPALLATCRQIHSEATAILYTNADISVRAHDLPKFVAQVGTSIRHVRSLKILLSRQDLRLAMGLLTNASGLKTLELVGQANCGLAPQDIAGDVALWAGAVLSGDTDKNEVRKVVEMLKISPGLGRRRESDDLYEKEVKSKLFFKLMEGGASKLAT